MLVGLPAALDLTSGINLSSVSPVLGRTGIFPLLESNGVNNEEQTNPDLQEHSIASRSLRVSSTFDAPQILTEASSLLGHHIIIILP